MILLVVAFFLLLAPPLVAQSRVAIDYAKLREETAQRLSECIRINTSNPPGNELAAACWLNDVLAKEGIRGMILDTAELGPGQANFYARATGRPGRTRDRAGAPHRRGHRHGEGLDGGSLRRRDPRRATSGAGARWT
jgi:hypothetical protein